MATTWTLLEPKLQRLLSDTAGSLYDSTLRIDAINAALAIYSGHTAVENTQALAGDGSVTSWSLPGDYLELGAVWCTKEAEWLEAVSFIPGEEWSDQTPRSGSTPRGYYLWPQETLNVTWLIASGDGLTLYYYGYWGEVTTGSSSIGVPQWAREALIYYAAAYCLAPGGVQAATIGQYDTRRDSGNPEHNPVFEQAKYYMEMYQTTIGRYAVQQRDMMYRIGRGL